MELSNLRNKLIKIFFVLLIALVGKYTFNLLVPNTQGIYIQGATDVCPPGDIANSQNMGPNCDAPNGFQCFNFTQTSPNVYSATCDYDTNGSGGLIQTNATCFSGGAAAQLGGTQIPGLNGYSCVMSYNGTSGLDSNVSCTKANGSTGATVTVKNTPSTQYTNHVVSTCSCPSAYTPGDGSCGVCSNYFQNITGQNVSQLVANSTMDQYNLTQSCGLSQIDIGGECGINSKVDYQRPCTPQQPSMGQCTTSGSTGTIPVQINYHINLPSSFNSTVYNTSLPNALKVNLYHYNGGTAVSDSGILQGLDTDVDAAPGGQFNFTGSQTLTCKNGSNYVPCKGNANQDGTYSFSIQIPNMTAGVKYYASIQPVTNYQNGSGVTGTISQNTAVTQSCQYNQTPTCSVSAPDTNISSGSSSATVPISLTGTASASSGSVTYTINGSVVGSADSFNVSSGNFSDNKNATVSGPEGSTTENLVANVNFNNGQSVSCNTTFNLNNSPNTPSSCNAIQVTPTTPQCGSSVSLKFTGYANTSSTSPYAKVNYTVTDVLTGQIVASGGSTSIPSGSFTYNSGFNTPAGTGSRGLTIAGTLSDTTGAFSCSGQTITPQCNQTPNQNSSECDITSSNLKFSPLQIDGSVVATNIFLDRDLGQYGNVCFPAESFFYDARYQNLYKGFFYNTFKQVGF